MDKAFVYLWYDAKNKMYYLGSSKGNDPYYAHSSSIMEKFTLKTTPPHMHRRILARGTHQEMIDLENELLNIRKERCWDRYYNVITSFPPPTMSGENHYMYGKKHSPETLEKISKAQSGKKQSPESNLKRSKALSGENNPMYGKRGENNPNFGRKASTETRKKMSKAQSGKKRSPESNLKRSKAMSGANNPMYGKKPSPETLEKLSKAKSGDNNPMSRKNREARQRKKLEQEGITQLDNYLK